MRNKLGDKVRLMHILDAIEEIETYLINVEYSDFMENSMMRFACIKQMEIIGEASNHITKELKTTYKEINWSQIIGLRNFFAHEYFGIDIQIVWAIIKNDIPVLKQKIIVILESLK